MEYSDASLYKVARISDLGGDHCGGPPRDGTGQQGADGTAGSAHRITGYKIQLYIVKKKAHAFFIFCERGNKLSFVSEELKQGKKIFLKSTFREMQQNLNAFLTFFDKLQINRPVMSYILLAVQLQIDFVAGVLVGPRDPASASRGFVGLDSGVLGRNLWSDYGGGGGGGGRSDFFSVFAVFFPAVTGIVAGANLSGDLKVCFAAKKYACSFL